MEKVQHEVALLKQIKMVLFGLDGKAAQNAVSCKIEN